jgi:hypothetical protein
MRTLAILIKVVHTQLTTCLRLLKKGEVNQLHNLYEALKEVIL